MRSAVHQALVGDHGGNLVAQADDGGYGAAALSHAVNLGQLDVLAAGHGASRKNIGGKKGALAAHATQHDGLGATHDAPPSPG